MAGKLTAAKVREINDPGHHADGQGLYLSVSPGLTKSWTLRTTVDGTRIMRGLGSVKKISLAQARKAAAANKATLRAGKEIKPKSERVERDTGGVPTLAEAVATAHDLKRNQWRDSYAQKWLREINNHVIPTLGDHPVNEVTRQELADVLTPALLATAATGKRLRANMRVVFSWAVAAGHCEVNPADDALDWLIKKPVVDPDAAEPHRKALPYADVPAAFETVRRRHALVDDTFTSERDGRLISYRVERRITPPTGMALRLVVLTACRVSEAAGMTWDEVDWDNRVWTLPASRTKQKAVNIIPLSEAAMDALRHAARQFGGRDGYVFPTKKGTPVASKALSDAVRVLQLGCTAHGFRSSYRDWSAETFGPDGRDAAEKQLGHMVAGKTERAYYRSQLVEERRAQVQAWGEFVTGAPF